MKVHEVRAKIQVALLEEGQEILDKDYCIF